MEHTQKNEDQAVGSTSNWQQTRYANYNDLFSGDLVYELKI
jgi:hypothetical protein